MSFKKNCRPTWVNTVLPELEEALPSIWVHTQSEGKHHKIHELLKKSRERVLFYNVIQLSWLPFPIKIYIHVLHRESFCFLTLLTT